MLPMQGTSPEAGGTGLYDRWRRLSGDADRLPAKVILTHTSYEYWGRAASLTHTTPDGRRDAPLDANERIYLLAGSQHFVDGFPPQPFGTRYAVNPHNTRFAMRALLLALDAWVRDGKAPPASRYPKLADGTLVAVDKVRFPSLPGVSPPQREYRPRPLDFGPRFASQGIIDRQPPQSGEPWWVGVPQVDADGNEVAGLRLPEVAVPVATYSGWNLRSSKAGASDEMADYRGSFFPFQCSSGKQRGGGDPRPSLEERYEERAGYLRRFLASAEKATQDGYLLSRDLPSLQRRGEALWRLICGP
jgi:hypothetical protein